MSDQRAYKNLVMRRFAECVAMAMIGDGALALLHGQKHERLWEKGPKLWQEIIKPFSNKPWLVRSVGAAELVAGFWLARQQLPSKDEEEA